MLKRIKYGKMPTSVLQIAKSGIIFALDIEKHTEFILFTMTKLSNEFLEMRNKELIASYKKILKEEFAKSGVVSRRRIVERVIYESHPRFHVSYEHAYKVLSTVRNHGFGGFKLSLRRQMWQELLELVEAEMKERPYLNFGHALSRVLAEKRASRFYISPEYCYKYLYNIA